MALVVDSVWVPPLHIVAVAGVTVGVAGNVFTVSTRVITQPEVFV